MCPNIIKIRIILELSEGRNAKLCPELHDTRSVTAVQTVTDINILGSVLTIPANF
jgi:hypothetical protein